MTHIDKLRELAAKATAGEWKADRHGLGVFQKNGPIVAELMNKSGAFTNHEADAAYIASLSPDVVVRLLDAAQAGRGLLDAYARADEDDCPLQEAASIVRDATAALRDALDALEKME